MYRYAVREGGADRDSEDPVDDEELADAEQEGDQSHLRGLFSRYRPPRAQQRTPHPEELIDLDEDMDSDQGSDSAGSGGEDVEHNMEDDAAGSMDEEMSIYLKPKAERQEIEEEIADLEDAVPELTTDYKIVDRLGTGTFSSVYKAVDLGYHAKWDNAPWQGHHAADSSAYYQTAARPQGSKVFVAIKRIYATSSPERIRNEITIMETCRGARHVSQIITAFRREDQVVTIMPYHRNEDFRVRSGCPWYHACIDEAQFYFNVMPMEGIKSYFRCLFRALRDIHSRGIIHRDVKPANFLFDPRTGVGTLCDFGLACVSDPFPANSVKSL